MVSAMVLAAGLSTRMGGTVPKPLLPWGSRTILEQVVTTLLAAGLDDVLVITGHRREAVEAMLASYAVRCVFNPTFAGGEMLSSVQTGLRAFPAACTGALLTLADQPQMQVEVVRQVVTAFRRGGEQAIVVPSYQMRRGHPILLPSWLWPEVLDLPAAASLRSVMARHAAAIHYVVVDTPSVLADLDTPEQYRAAAERILNDE